MPGSTWTHDVALAATDEGVWLGTSEDYEVELIDWTGETIRRIRWEGPDLAVTQEDVDRYRDALEESYRDDDDPNWRARFESIGGPITWILPTTGSPRASARRVHRVPNGPRDRRVRKRRASPGRRPTACPGTRDPR